MKLEDVCATVGCPPPELTRRDVARALLTVPAKEALAGLPRLRRELVAAGVPLSALFWDRTEDLLSAIAHGSATVGDVRRWLEATGSEPNMLVGGGFLWPEEEERGPVATELHARLVARLEDLVAQGRIDPDRLLAGDEEALAAYEEEQLTWLRTPLEDGREPMWAVADEESEEFLAAWDDAEADALQILTELLDELGPRPCPDAELRTACRRLRADLVDPTWPYNLLAAAAGVAPEVLPDDDRELWLTLAAGVVTTGEVTPEDSYIDDDTHVAWLSLDHPDWIGAIVTLARSGPGTAAGADALARYAATFDFEEDACEADAMASEEHDDVADPWRYDDTLDDLDVADEELALSIGFHPVALLWHVLGAVDDDERLTALGWWGLPEALQAAWRPDDGRSPLRPTRASRGSAERRSLRRPK